MKCVEMVKRDHRELLGGGQRIREIRGRKDGENEVKRLTKVEGQKRVRIE